MQHRTPGSLPGEQLGASVGFCPFRLPRSAGSERKGQTMPASASPSPQEQYLCDYYRKELARSEQRDVSEREALAMVRISGLRDPDRRGFFRFLRDELTAILREHGLSGFDDLADHLADYPTNVFMAAHALVCIASITKDKRNALLYSFKLGSLIARMTTQAEGYLLVRGIIADQGSRRGGASRSKSDPSYRTRVMAMMKKGRSWTYACECVGAESGVSGRTVERHTPDLNPKKRPTT
jgi:hypothetical protein